MTENTVVRGNLREEP